MPALDSIRNQFDDFYDTLIDGTSTRIFGAVLPVLGDTIGNRTTGAVDYLNDARDEIIGALDALIGDPDADTLEAIADALNGVSVVQSADVVGDEIIITIGDMGGTSLGDTALETDLGLTGIGFEATADLSLEQTQSYGFTLRFDEGAETLSLDPGASFAVGIDGNAQVEAEAQLGFFGLLLTLGGMDPEFDLDFSVTLGAGDVSALTLDDFETVLDGGIALDLELETLPPSEFLPTILTGLDYTLDFQNVLFDGSGFEFESELTFDEIRVRIDALGGLLEGTLGQILGITDVFPLDKVIAALNARLPVIDDFSVAFPALRGDDDTVQLRDLIEIFAQNNPNLEWLDKLLTVIDAFEFLGQIADLGDEGIVIGNFDVAGDVLDALENDNPFAGFDLGAAQPVLDAVGDFIAELTDNVEPAEQPDFSDVLQIPLLSEEGPALVADLLLNGPNAAPLSVFELDFPFLGFSEEAELVFRILGPIAVRIGGSFSGGIELGFGYDLSGINEDGSFDFLEGFYLSTEALPDGGFAPVAGISAGLNAGAGLDAVVVRAFVNGGILGEIDLFLNDDADGIVDGRTHLATTGFPCLFEELQGRLIGELFATLSFGVGPFSYDKRFDFVSAVIAQFEADLCPPANDGPPSTLIADAGLATLGVDGFAAGDLVLNMGEARADLRDLPDGIGEGATAEAFRITYQDELDDPDFDPARILVEAFGLQEAFTGASRIVADAGSDNDGIYVDVALAASLNGGDGDDQLFGNALNDTLEGGEGSDGLYGNGGADILLGGAGNDFLEGGEGADSIDGGADFDQVDFSDSDVSISFTEVEIDGQGALIGTGGTAHDDTLVGVEHIVGSDFGDTLISPSDNSGQTILEGLDGADALTGTVDSADLLVGGPGGDVLNGGGFDASDDGDVISYISSEGAVEVDLQTLIARGGDAQGDLIFFIEGVGGSAYNDTLRGNSADNVLTGSIGDDLLEGRAGNDTVSGGGGDDTVLALADGDELDGGGIRNLSDDRDLLSYAAAAGAVTVSLISGTASGGGVGGTDTLAFEFFAPDPLDAAFDVIDLNRSSFEDVLGSVFADDITGDFARNRLDGGNGNDTITALDGNDTIVGGLGADSLDGGGGIDTADYSGSALGVTVFLAGDGPNTGGEAEGDSVTSMENVIGSNDDDILSGTNGQNRFAPLLGAELMDGRDGVDTLELTFNALAPGIGGLNMLALPDPMSGEIAGSHTVGTVSSSFFTSIEEFEVVGTNSDDVILIGATGNDVFHGEDGDDIINAGQGADRVFGGRGDDFIGVDMPNPGTFSGVGGLAPDELDGGRGVDRLNVGLSQATANVVLAMRQNPVEDPNQLLVLPNGTVIRRFEIIQDVATGSGDDVLIQPGTEDNVFFTGAGDDIIAPGLGNDIVFGGENARGVSDTDVLILDFSSIGPAIITSFADDDGGGSLEIPGFGAIDGSRTIYTQIERLILTGTNGNDDVTGITDDGYGGPGDLIEVLDGDDTVDGGGSDDTIRGDNGNDELRGGDGNDLLEGGEDADTLLGGDGNDTLVAGVAGAFDGFDNVTGGGGADLFVLGDEDGLAYADSPAMVFDGVFVTDFDRAQGDRIQLSGSAADYEIGNSLSGDVIRLVDGDGMGTDIAFALIVNVFDLTFADIDFVPVSSTAAAAASAPANLSGPAVAAGPSAQDAIAEFAALFDGMAVAADVGTLVQDLQIGIATPVEEIDRQGNAEAIRAAALNASAPIDPPPDDTPVPPSIINGLGVTPAQLIVNQLAGFGGGIVQNPQLEGDQRAFGTLLGEFLGLGEEGPSPTNFTGGVISTGVATDIEGTNRIDGGIFADSSSAGAFELEFVNIGEFGESQIYRADLSGVPVELRSLLLTDSNSKSGGAGGQRSGFDFDAVILSEDLVANSADFASVDAIDAFDFSPESTFFTPGTQRSGGTTPDLFGEVNGIVNQPVATLDAADAAPNDGAASTGFVSVGDGGSIGFNFAFPVAAEADGELYLYVAEAGVGAGQTETITGLVSGSRQPIGKPSDLSTDFGFQGSDGDTTRITQSFTIDLGELGEGEGYFTELFNVILLSDEFVEYAGRSPQDSFSVKLNGEEVLVLSDGHAPTISNLANAPIGPYHEDFVYNGLGINDFLAAGPSIDLTRADGYTEVLTVAGFLRNGRNTIEIEVADTRDGLLDSAIAFAGIGEPVELGFGTRLRDVIAGTDGPDVITAGRGNDRIDAGAGNDIIDAGPGRDRVLPGPGRDVVTLGPGRDRLVVRPGDGEVIVTDFNPRADRLDVTALGRSDVLDAIANASGPDATLIFDDGTRIVLEGVLADDLSTRNVKVAKPADVWVNARPRMVEEGQQGDETTATFVVKRDGNPGASIALDLSFGGSIDAGDLAAPLPSRLTLGPGESRALVEVAIAGDSDVERHEKLSLSIETDPTSAGDAMIRGRDSATVTVRNDDAEPIEGTAGNDVLRGTNGDDVIDGKGGRRDKLIGRDGDDLYDLAATVMNGSADKTIIRWGEGDVLTGIDGGDVLLDTVETTRRRTTFEYGEEGDTVVLTGFLGDLDTLFV